MEYIKRHKVPFIVAAALLVAAIVLFFVLRGIGGGSTGGVYVQSVRDLTLSSGAVNRFAGVAESQKVEKVARDSQKTVKEIYVAAGDSVKKGDKLFSYDTELMQLDVQQAQLEIESMQSTINTDNAQIAQYQRERQSASGSDRLSYDAQIQQLQAEINSTNYQMKTKQADLERLKQGLSNSDVLSPADGTIEAVGTNEEPLDTENTMVTVRNGGDLRIKGSVSEQNIMSISVGDPVVVRSRVDKNQTWAGTIESIDTGSTEKSENEYYGGMDNGSRASYYAFFVDLEDAEGLIMGQHVTIEPDWGQGGQHEGLWLSSGFVADPEGEAYVWAANSRMKLEKRPVTLGEYDPELDEYQILDGLTEDDLIAWPDERCVPGAACTTELVIEDEDYGDYEDYANDEFYGSMEDEFYSEEGIDGELPGEDGVIADAEVVDGADAPADEPEG